MPGNSRSRQKRKPKLEPISYEEMLGAAGMSGFVSFLEISPSGGKQSAVDGSSNSTKLAPDSAGRTLGSDAAISGTPDPGVQQPVLYPPSDRTTASTSNPATAARPQHLLGVDVDTPIQGAPLLGDVITGTPNENIREDAQKAPGTEQAVDTTHFITTNIQKFEDQRDTVRGIPYRGGPHKDGLNKSTPVSQSRILDSDHDSLTELLDRPDPQKTAAVPQQTISHGVPDIGTPQNNESIRARAFSAAHPTIPPRPSSSPVLEAHGTTRDGDITTGVIRYPMPDSGIPNTPFIPIGPYATSTIPRTHRLRRATRVQDGHSLGEQALYDALWQAAQPYSADARIIMVGYRRMSELARLTVNNCKANIKALIQKLAVDEAAPFSHSQGTTYVVYNFSAILQRRKAAGLTFYIRSRGVVFVDPETGLPLTTSTHSKSGTPEKGWSHPISIPESDNKGIPIADRSGVPEAVAHKERNTTSQQVLGTSSTLPIPEDLIQTFHQILPAIDNDAITTIWNECRARVQDCTVKEIAYFARSKAVALNNGKIQNPVGFLLAAVPKCFEGQTFQVFRQEEARRRQEQQRREEEEREERLQFEEQNRREAEAYCKAEEALATLSQSEHTDLYEHVKSDLKRNYPHINWPNREALEDRIRIGMIRELQKRAGV